MLSSCKNTRLKLYCCENHNLQIFNQIWLFRVFFQGQPSASKPIHNCNESWSCVASLKTWIFNLTFQKETIHYKIRIEKMCKSVQLIFQLRKFFLDPEKWSRLHSLKLLVFRNIPLLSGWYMCFKCKKQHFFNLQQQDLWALKSFSKVSVQTIKNKKLVIWASFHVMSFSWYCSWMNKDWGY